MIAKLSFKIYDVENSGVIRKWEMKLVLEEIYLDAKNFWKDDMNSTNNNSEKKELLQKKLLTRLMQYMIN